MTPRRLRPLAALVAAALVAGLSACSASVPVRVAAARDGSVGQEPASTVVDDASTASLLLVPAHPNGALAVFVHGSGQTRESLVRSPHDYSVARTLVQHGYLVLAADAHGRAWGDPASVADYRSLIATTVRTHDIRDVFLMAESMGGLATMQLAARVPAVRAVTAWFPVCDLRSMIHTRFGPAIAKAWTTGDRRAVSPVAVPRVPLTVWASASDTVVPAARNAAVCAAEDRAAGGAVTYVRTTGEHGDGSNFRPAAVLAFFDAHRHPAAQIRPAVEQSATAARS